MILPFVNALDDKPLLSIPDERLSAYKYFTKLEYFKDFICTKSLFFSRISNWDGDLSEGIIPRDVFSEIFKSFVKNYNLSEKQKKDYGDYERHYQLYKVLTHYQYACCFHVNEHESLHMWDEYANDKCVIAIRTSIGKIRKTFQQDILNQFIIGSVIYDKSQLTIDFLKENNYRSFYKRKKYQKEREFRVLICSPSPYDRIEKNYVNNGKPHAGYLDFKEYDLDEEQKAGMDSEKGEKISVDLEYFIDEVILRPNAESNLEPKIRLLINDKIQNPSKIIIRPSNL